MKSLTKLITLALFASLAFSACKKEEQSSGGTVQDMVENKAWKVTYYFDSSKDVAPKFTGYIFEFEAYGKMRATGSNTYLGIWSVNNSCTRLLLDFGSVAPFEDLNDDWLIHSQTDSKIILKDDNADKSEELQFGKI